MTDKSLWRRLMGSVLFILAAVYVIIFLAGIFLANSMMFVPGPPSYGDDSSIIKIPTANGSVISAQLRENRASRYTILFSHGNAEDLGNLTWFLKEFNRHGFSIMAYDYCGYGTSSGKPSEQAVLDNAEAVYAYLTTKRGIAPEQIIVWGRSIGSGPSTYLAATRKVGGLVIESGFTSAFRVMTRIRLLPFDRFDNLQKMSHISCPVLVIHGRQDKIIPFRHGLQLFEAARQPKINFWVDRSGHNDLLTIAGEAYWETARRFEQLVESSNK